MTLKELRISKGLSQAECAKYLGMSTRNYQNYENDDSKVSTIKYDVIYRKIEEYGKNNSFSSFTHNYCTNVTINEKLLALTNEVKKYKKRYCFSSLEKYITGSYYGKICILYGLRRTGKTTLIFQMINELPIDQTAYIKINSNDNMKNLLCDLNDLFDKGYKYIFIDEITLMEDFINTSSTLSDLFASMGMKIVLSGTDSLGFDRAIRDELYDRNILIHTTYIPFREYSYLLNINSIDKYIEYGGTLKIENMDFNDEDASFDEVSFRNDESTRKYIDSAISRNIQHSLKNDSFDGFFSDLKELYDKGELTNVINRIVENMNHQFLLSVVTDKFKSHDLGSSKELLLHDFPQKRSTVLYDIDYEQVMDRLKKIIDVKETSETKIKINQNIIDKVKIYLERLDLLIECVERYEDKGQKTMQIFTQPGMRYSIIKALVYSLSQDEYFKNISEIDKNYISQKILSDVKGRMLEDIVLLEKMKCSKNEDVFKFKFTHGGEFDMVVYDKINNTSKIYEIKHSNQINEKQTRYLKDDNKCKIIKDRFGFITGKYVIYCGEDKTVDGIEYLNVEQYLKNLA